MFAFFKRSFAAVLVVVAVFFLSLDAQAQSLTITTFAGPPGAFPGDPPTFSSIGWWDGMDSAARFNNPRAVATDSSGNAYVADSDNHTIRKITPTGAVTTLVALAGNFGSVDGTGSVARFYNPAGVATDSSGNVYVADTNNFTIRKITPAGVVTTLAGLAGSFGSVDGAGSAARFYYPIGVATDSSGNVYIGDSGSGTIRKITPAGMVTTLAGLAGSFGSVDGTGSAARFNTAYGVATDSSGNVYVADRGNCTVRKVTPSGAVTTLAGLAGACGSADGTGSAARFSGPAGVAIDSIGNVYVADSLNSTIRKITPSGAVTTLAGLAGNPSLIPPNVDGIGSAARFSFPAGVATDSLGNVYVADSLNSTIRKITPAAVVTTLAGPPGNPGSADGTGSASRFRNPAGIAIDTSGNVYIADSYNETIRKITPAGAVTTLAGLPVTFGSADGTGSAARFNNPSGVATDSSGNVYVADYNNSTIRKITPAGAVTTLAGLAGSLGSVDGTGSAARFRNPSAVATDSSGNVYVADYNNSTIRKITPAGVVTTLAGLAGIIGSADGTGSAAQFNLPNGVATDSSGNIYVADSGNATIRKITPAGAVTTLAGLTGTIGSADGMGSAAQFNNPSGVATDSSGNVYVTDRGNSTIRKITPAGTVTTLAGVALTRASVDGTGNAARLYHPNALVIDSSGNVYIADTTNNIIRLGRAALADMATIDLSSGAVGIARQLDTAPKTATSWQWSVIRRPADSVADFSSATIRNPTFAPDVPGLFTFRLIASTPTAASVGTVDFTAGVFPRGDANGDGQVTVTDIFYLINNLFANGPAPIGPGDANGDGQVTVTDVFYLINFLFTGGPPPR